MTTSPLKDAVVINPPSSLLCCQVALFLRGVPNRSVQVPQRSEHSSSITPSLTRMPWKPASPSFTDANWTNPNSGHFLNVVKTLISLVFVGKFCANLAFKSSDILWRFNVNSDLQDPALYIIISFSFFFTNISETRWFRFSTWFVSQPSRLLIQQNVLCRKSPFRIIFKACNIIFHLCVHNL